MNVPRLLLLSAFVLTVSARAEVKPNSLFSDNAVLQRDLPLPVWGEAADGENVTVEFAGQRASTIAQGGRWKVVLPPHAAGGPFTMTIRGTNTLTLNNILLGDVWVASGQSNMERQLGPRGGQPEIDNWRQEVATADYPLIREYYVPEIPSLTPKTNVDAHWTVCSPQTVQDFTAVGYFFARDLHKAINVPIGILFTSWGGTQAEAWTSAAGLKTLPDFAPGIRQMEAAAAGTPAVTKDEYYAAHDPGSAPGHSWAAPGFDASAWKTPAGATYYEVGPDQFEGIIWTRREFELPAGWAGQAAVLHLGRVDDDDTTFVNGVRVGASEGWDTARNYPISAGVLKPGRNVVAVRILNTSGGGGMLPADSGQLTLTAPALAPVPLSGEWRYQTTTPMAQLPGLRSDGVSPGTWTALFNGMIAPLLPFPIKGVVWYQGESNQDRAEQYKTLFPAMIADWRQHWGLGNFPFLFVQIAPYHDMKPEIREAQFLTLAKSPNTAMAVTTDIGEADNIHPPHKAPVGARLALAAQALAYGKRIEYSGPLYQSMQAGLGRITLNFRHVGSGLLAKDGPLKGFVIAGADGNFVPAQAEIQGNGVAVSSPQVSQPVAVRYGWANVPDCNLFNREGLPASPFRTDDGTQAHAVH